MVLENISEGFCSLCSSNFRKCIFCHNSQLLCHPTIF